VWPDTAVAHLFPIPLSLSTRALGPSGAISRNFTERPTKEIPGYAEYPAACSFFAHDFEISGADLKQDAAIQTSGDQSHFA
jgi:hypothetical protein